MISRIWEEVDSMGLAECSRSYDCGIPLFFCLFFSEYLEEKNIAYTFACEMSTRTLTDRRASPCGLRDWLGGGSIGRTNYRSQY